MEVGHDEEADADADEAKEFDAVEATDAVGETVGDFLVEYDDSGAGGDDEDA